MSEKVIKDYTKLREDSSIILNTLNKIADNTRSRGLSLSITSLEKGRMYVGEVLRTLGKAYPYEKTKEATKPSEIQKAVDTSDKVLPLEGNEIVDLNKLREVLEKKTEEMLDTFMTYAEKRGTGISNKQRFLEDAMFAEAYRCYKEARMWLGIRLGEIKDNE